MIPFIALCALGIAALELLRTHPLHQHRNDAADSQGSAGSGVSVGGHVAMRNTAKSE